MKKIIKKYILALCLVPLVFGTIGYLLSGERFTDSLYAGIALYFTSPVSDAYNGYIEFSRWTALLVTATAILHVLETVWNHIIWWFMSLSKNSVAIYSDQELGIKFEKGVKAIYPGEGLKKCAQSHIILFSSDQKSLEFYEENKAILEKKPVYIGIREIEPGLIDTIDGTILFDINGSISRLLWKELKLWNREKMDVSIVIYGDGLLAQTILAYGLVMNLYSNAQHIKYHVVSENAQFQAKHPGFPLYNGDDITYHNASGQDIWELVRGADVVVLADMVPAGLLQTFAVNTDKGELYYYSPNKGNVGDYIALGHMKAFGSDEDILTDENIRRQTLIQAAIALNRHYADAYGGEKDWNNLSGFLKNSNISSADFNEVLAGLPDSMPEEELAELEHIRWSRFHYLNYWKQGEPSNGRNKDAKRRIHRDLVPYGQLSNENKEKSRAIVKMARRDKQGIP